MAYLSKSHLYVDAIRADIKAERLVSGFGAEGKGDNFKGCWIGCALREFSYSGMAEKMHWPIELVRICETIFEGLCNTEREQSFAVNILDAPKANADVSLVHWKFLHWMVSDTLEKYANKQVQDKCAPALKVLLEKASGKEVSGADAEAAYATCAAEAADAADAVAYATRAAAYATCAARRDRYKEMSDKLIELMKEAPITA